MKCFFVSDLHGNIERYKILFSHILEEKPDAVFMGGDLLPHGYAPLNEAKNFLEESFFNEIRRIREKNETRFFIIMGNDDPMKFEKYFTDAHREKTIDYVHDRTVGFGNLYVSGYSYVPPTPFMLKDWERYDISRYVDPGCISPEEGFRTVPLPDNEVKYSTIVKDLERLSRNSPQGRTIFLFHSPPYNSKLDRAGLDGRMIDHVPLDVHVGSMAIQRFIKEEQPFLTLHGHVHESVSLTGTWHEKIEETFMFTGAHHGPELALVRFDTADLKASTRELVPII